ncbi:MAG: hypothetical protein ACYTGC_15020 [Planctomycetota bacterium]|jgi:hypothetical protein
MNDIRSLLQVAARRIELASFVASAHLAAMALAALALALMLADRAGATSFVPWLWVVPALLAIGALVAAAMWSRRRKTELQVALSVDDRLDLREKLSTALHCEGREDPFARAAIEDAVTVARDPRTREKTRRLFKVGAPGGWWASPLLVLAVMMVWMLPPLDLFAREEEDPADEAKIEQAKREVEVTVEAVIEEVKQNAQLSESMEDLLGELTKEPLDADEFKTPEDLKRDALKKVTELNKRLEEILGGEDGKTAEALRDSLKDIQSPEDGPGKALSEALANGDFGEAKKALEDLMEQVQNGEMNEEQKQKLADQLADLAKQLEELAQKQQQLQKALEQAGMNPQLAQNPEALKQALQNNPNLNQQQIQQLMQMAKAQQAASKMCEGLGQGMGQMAAAMAQGQMGMMGQGAENLADQLNQMEMLQMLLDQAQAAANACQGQCQGLGQGLGKQQFGPGMGQRGMGAGGTAPIAPTPWKARKEKANVFSGEGDIIARMLFDGPEVVGESTIKAKQVAVELLEAYDDALVEEQLPRKYHDPHKHYFGEMKKRTESSEPAAAEKPAKPANEPANGE